MAGPEDDLDAAERALGTLPRAGEAVAEARRRREWELRLAPLAALLAPVSPPDGLLGRIMERIGDEEAARTLRVERRRTARWRLATIAMTAAAAAALAAIVLPPESGPELVSVVVAEDGAPALVVSLGPEQDLATVRPVGIRAPSDGSLELWHIPQGGAPASLGLIDAATPQQVAISAAPGDLAAVSLEPAGGSPTGQPTGPVLYKGVFLDIR